MKIKKLVPGILLLTLVLPLIVAAQVPTPVQNTSDVIKVLNNVKNLIWIVLGVLVVIMFIWAGITFVTSEGDPGKIGKARDRLLYGIIGIIVALLAGGVLMLIQSVMS
jgi:intracellular sulfur oxidation DsrE/DsrF family protein